VLPEQFMKANWDEDLPNVGEVSSGVKGDTKGGAYCIWRDQDMEKAQNLGEKTGGGSQEMMLSDRKARDWLLRTGLESTQLSGRGVDRMSRGAVSGVRAALASVSTVMFMASLAWARVQEKHRELECVQMRWSMDWNSWRWETGEGATSQGSEKRGSLSHLSCSMASRPLCASPRT
jgi:hypothetical protein